MEASTVRPVTVRKARMVEYNDGDKTKQRVVEEDVIAYPEPQPDHMTRVKAAEAAAKLRGDIKRAETTITAGVQSEGFKFIFMVDSK